MSGLSKGNDLELYLCTSGLIYIRFVNRRNRLLAYAGRIDKGEKLTLVSYDPFSGTVLLYSDRGRVVISEREFSECFVQMKDELEPAMTIDEANAREDG